MEFSTLPRRNLQTKFVAGSSAPGADRVEMASSRSTPMVLAPGCVDMCNFSVRSAVPAKYQMRRLYEWNPNVTLLRTNVEENVRIGEMLAMTANRAVGPVVVLVPLKGISMLDSPDGPFWEPAADRSCFDALRKNLRSDIPFEEVDANINDPQFADRAAQLLLDMMKNAGEA